MSLGAFIGALTAFLFVAPLAMAARQSGSATTQIILAGIASSQLFNAITSLIITRSANAEQARGIMFWLLGNLSGVRWPDVVLAIPTALIGIVVCFCYARHLDAFSFGAESAASLGIPVKRTRGVLIAAVTGMTAIMVSIVGAIGFVGLVIPMLRGYWWEISTIAYCPSALLLVPFSLSSRMLFHAPYFRDRSCRSA